MFFLPFFLLFFLSFFLFFFFFLCFCVWGVCLLVLFGFVAVAVVVVVVVALGGRGWWWRFYLFYPTVDTEQNIHEIKGVVCSSCMYTDHVVYSVCLSWRVPRNRLLCPSLPQTRCSALPHSSDGGAPCDGGAHSDAFDVDQCRWIPEECFCQLGRCLGRQQRRPDLLPDRNLQNSQQPRDRMGIDRG